MAIERRLETYTLKPQTHNSEEFAMTELATQPFWMGETFWIVLLIVVGLVVVAFIYHWKHAEEDKSSGWWNRDGNEHSRTVDTGNQGQCVERKNNVIQNRAGIRISAATPCKEKVIK